MADLTPADVADLALFRHLLIEAGWCIQADGHDPWTDPSALKALIEHARELSDENERLRDTLVALGHDPDVDVFGEDDAGEPTP